jgi:hypothetical protein
MHSFLHLSERFRLCFPDISQVHQNTRSLCWAPILELNRCDYKLRTGSETSKQPPCARALRFSQIVGEVLKINIPRLAGDSNNVSRDG